MQNLYRQKPEYLKELRAHKLAVIWAVLCKNIPLALTLLLNAPKYEPPVIPYWSANGIVKNHNTNEQYTNAEFTIYYNNLPKNGTIHLITGDCSFLTPQQNIWKKSHQIPLLIFFSK